MNKSLHNEETGITIGYMLYKNKYVLYVQKGQTRRLFATFREKSVADEFIETMKEFDWGGVTMVIYDMEYPETCGECNIYNHNIRDCSICCHGKPIPPSNKRKPHWCPVKGEITNEEWEGVQRERSNQHLRPDANQNSV